MEASATCSNSLTSLALEFVDVLGASFGGGCGEFRAPRLHTQSSPALHSGKGASPRKPCRDAATLSAFEGVGGFGATPKQLLHAQL